jgi:hypothetical protein
MKFIVVQPLLLLERELVSRIPFDFDCKEEIEDGGE